VSHSPSHRCSTCAKGWWPGEAFASLRPRNGAREILPVVSHAKFVCHQNRVINPIAMLAHDLGIPPPGDALLETTGRPRPGVRGLDGEAFWSVVQRRRLGAGGR